VSSSGVRPGTCGSTPTVRDGSWSLPHLGAGILYNPSLSGFLRDHIHAYDYLEIIPDMFWTDGGRGVEPRYIELGTWVDELEALAGRVPLVSHSTGFSLGSADGFDIQPVEHLAEWHRRYGFMWHSDHLSFVRVSDGDGHDENAALALPFPYDEEMLDLVVDRVDLVQGKVPLPFLIENNVAFVEAPEQEMSEPQFLNRLHERTGCGLLLDLHNLYANARNHRFDALDFLDDLNLRAVVEIHIAGGSELGGMWTDSHAGPVAEPVWDLLEATVPRTPALCGITFEFHDSYFSLLGDIGVAEQLVRARSAWDRLHPSP
jgi:uncharacterized protein